MSEEALRLRLKPKLAPEPPAQPARAPVMSAAPAAVEPVAPPPLTPAPVAATPPALPSAEPSAAFRLKPKVPTLPTDLAKPPPVPPPVVVAAAAPSGRPAAALAAQGRKVQLAALCIGAAGTVLFGVIGYLTYSGQLRAESLLFTDNESEMIGGKIGDTADTDATPEPKAPIAAAPADGPTDAVARAPEAPQPAAVLPATAPDVEPSDEFRAAVAAFKILGVRAGSNPRVLIAGAPYKPGDVVHAPLGIVFSGYDADRRLVRFQDASGARLERPDR